MIFLPMRRCAWASSPLLIAYHDEEWGVPVHEDRRLFEFLILEGAQAGLSWETVLRKRPRYREVFDRFDPARIARYDDARISALLADPGIIRNRLKINAAVANARGFLEVREEFGAFSAYLWRFVNGAPIKSSSDTRRTHTEASDAMSKDLKERGFKFVGTTICYALMQAVGMVNDHEKSCFRYHQIGG